MKGGVGWFLGGGREQALLAGLLGWLLGCSAARLLGRRYQLGRRQRRLVVGGPQLASPLPAHLILTCPLALRTLVAYPGHAYWQRARLHLWHHSACCAPLCGPCHGPAAHARLEQMCSLFFLNSTTLPKTHKQTLHTHPCRQLGHRGGDMEEWTGTFRQAVASSFTCTGKEATLSQCDYYTSQQDYNEMPCYQESSGYGNGGPVVLKCTGAQGRGTDGSAWAGERAGGQAVHGVGGTSCLPACRPPCLPATLPAYLARALKKLRSCFRHGGCACWGRCWALTQLQGCQRAAGCQVRLSSH